MTENKKAWVTPELIVLVRSKPEEAVLTGCKTAAAAIGPSNAGAGTACSFPIGGCISCEAISGS